MKQPCTRDCPDRSATCATTCERWAKYVKWRNAEYENRRKLREFDEVTFNAKVKSIRRNFTHRRK